MFMKTATFANADCRNEQIERSACMAVFLLEIGIKKRGGNAVVIMQRSANHDRSMLKYEK